MHVTYDFSISEVLHIAILIGLVWKYLKHSSYIDFLIKNYPFHKHINGHIDYPPGLDPKLPRADGI